MNIPRFAILWWCIVCVFMSSQARSGSIPLKRIFDTPYVAGSRPSVAAISPDGSQVLYQWDPGAEDKSRLWSVALRGGKGRQLHDSAVTSCVWSPDGKRVAFVQKGDVFVADPEMKNITRLTRTAATEGQLRWSPDSKSVGMVTTNIIVMPATGPGFHQLTSNTSTNVSYRFIDFSPDGKSVLFASFDSDSLPEFIIPKYTDRHVTAPSSNRGFSRVRIGIAPVDTGKTVWLKTKGDRFLLGDVSFSPDGRRILYEQFSTNRKQRDMYVADPATGGCRLVYSEFDATWMEEEILDSRWASDGQAIYFTSEQDGWNHLYTMTRDSADIRQLTSGAWEVQWFNIHPDGRTIYLRGNKDDHGQKQLYALSIESREIRKLTGHEGTYDSPVMSKNGRVVVCRYSDFGKPGELVAIAEDKEYTLTSSVPDEFRRVEWVRPKIVRFTATDGREIPAMIYTPEDLDSTRKYPCVVFVHGAGYLQNVYRGWSYYYREYMFNSYLVHKGYVVFEVDYRGSAGYGRAFRTDVYMHLGGRDLQDELDGVEYLKRLGYIDSTRIGMYGGSYGGFLPLMALFTSPETYACAAVLRAVTSWENYYHHNPWYTEARLGTPEENPDAYERSSPLTFADSLKKPLLILHGMVDDNVFFQDAAQLVTKLIRAGKDFELMAYPVEGHAFTEPENWYDEYRRIDDFFDRHLLPNHR